MMRVYLVPGLLGSNLDCSDPVFPDNLWVNYTRLALCHFDYLRLADDGISPFPGTGRPCFANGISSSYYAAVHNALLTSPELVDQVVVDWSYDFRLSATRTGANLAAEIRSVVPPADPCAIVAHSFGGLVARVAWWELLRTGDQSRVRRIITIGTPHLGAYGIPVCW